MKYLYNNWKTLLTLMLGIVGLPLIAMALPQNPPTAPSLPRGVSYPSDYQTSFIHYATIQRPDGTIRHLYINPEAVQSFGQLPDQTTIVIEGYTALTDANGEFQVDDNGYYLPGESLEAVHVRQKRSDWSPADFVSELRTGQWNFGSFDVQSGQPYDESINACFNCHNASRQPEFLFSASLLAQYQQTGELQVYLCKQTGRTEC